MKKTVTGKTVIGKYTYNFRDGQWVLVYVTKTSWEVETFNTLNECKARVSKLFKKEAI